MSRRALGGGSSRSRANRALQRAGVGRRGAPFIRYARAFAPPARAWRSVSARTSSRDAVDERDEFVESVVAIEPVQHLEQAVDRRQVRPPSPSPSVSCDGLEPRDLQPRVVLRRARSSACAIRRAPFSRRASGEVFDCAISPRLAPPIMAASTAGPRETRARLRAGSSTGAITNFPEFGWKGRTKERPLPPSSHTMPQTAASDKKLSRRRPECQKYLIRYQIFTRARQVELPLASPAEVGDAALTSNSKCAALRAISQIKGVVNQSSIATIWPCVVTTTQSARGARCAKPGRRRARCRPARPRIRLRGCRSSHSRCGPRRDSSREAEDAAFQSNLSRRQIRRADLRAADFAAGAGLAGRRDVATVGLPRFSLRVFRAARSSSTSRPEASWSSRSPSLSIRAL